MQILEQQLDLLSHNSDAALWMQAFFEKRPSSGFPGSSYDPVDWIVPIASNHSARTNALTNWACGLLEGIVSQNRPGPKDLREEYLLEGIFSWVAISPVPDRLAPPLETFSQSAVIHSNHGWTSSLIRAFKRALIHNQIDNRHKTLWTDLLDGRKSDRGFGRYWPTDYEGLLHMPASKHEPFDWVAIGNSLKTIYETLLPKDNPKALSPTGPMRDLYRRLASLADLDDVSLNDRLWEFARQSKWSEAQQQTIPKHFYLRKSGKWMLPEVAAKIVIPARSKLKILGLECVVNASMEVLNAMEPWQLDVIKAYEEERRNSPRSYRPEMFYGNSGHCIPEAIWKGKFKKSPKQKRKTPEQILSKEVR